MQKEILKTWFFQQPPSEVWEYLTQPELLEFWLMKNDIKPVVGHKFRFTFQTNTESKYAGIVNCEVLEVRKFSKISYSWNGSTSDGSRTFNSIVVWTLIPKDAGTELQLSHKGLSFPEDILVHTDGWNKHFNRLEEKLNTRKNESTNT